MLGLRVSMKNVRVEGVSKNHIFFPHLSKVDHLMNSLLNLLSPWRPKRCFGYCVTLVLQIPFQALKTCQKYTLRRVLEH